MMDAISAVLWYIVTGLVILPGWQVARKIFPNDSPGQCAMHTVILVWTWIVLVSCSFGAFGVLNAFTLGCGSLLVAWGTWVWARFRFAGLAANVEAATLKANSQEWSARLSHIVWSLIASVGVVLACFYGVMQFPKNWDTLMYHRPLMVHWLQTGSLYVPQGAPWFAPGNNELMGLWWAAPFSGDYWVGLMNVPAALLLALGTFELSRLVGVKGLLSHAAVITTVGNSVVINQITDAKNDIAVTGLFIAGVSYGIRFLSSKRWTDLIFSGLALGLLSGTKYNAVGHAAVALLVISAMLLWTFGRRKTLLACSLLAVTMMLPSCYWYARNLVASGTPIYPIGYSSQHSPEVQPQQSVWRSTIVGNGRIEVWPQYVDAVYKQGNLCQVMALLILPVSLAWLFGSAAIFAKRAGQSGSSAVRAGVGVMIIGTLVIFGMTPFTVNVVDDQLLANSYRLVRFSLIPLTLLVICFGLLLEDLRRWLRSNEAGATLRSVSSVVLSAGFTGLAVWSLGDIFYAAAKDDWWLIALIAVDIVVLAQLFCRFIESRNRVSVLVTRLAYVATLVGGLVVFCVSTVSLSDWWHNDFAGHYDKVFRTTAFSELGKWDMPPPSVAAICNRYYPFFGSRRQYYVFRPRRVVSERLLLTYLDAEEINAVAAVHSSPSPFEMDNYLHADDWISNHKHIFQPIAIGSSFNLYRIDRGALNDHLNRLEPSVTSGGRVVTAR